MARPGTFATLLLAAAAPLSVPAQQTPAPQEAAEPLPRYNVEIVVFANNDVDPAEERFDREDAPGELTGLDGLIAVEPFGPASSANPFAGGPGFGTAAGFGDNARRFRSRDTAPFGTGADATSGGIATSGNTTPSPLTGSGSPAADDADATAAPGGDGLPAPLEFIYPFGRPPDATLLEGATSIQPAGGRTEREGPADVSPAGQGLSGTPTGDAATARATPADSVPPPPDFRVLRRDELMLDDAAGIVRRLGAYRLLGHAGWQQYGFPEDAVMAFNVARLGIPNPTGTISLYVGRFLHVRLDLDYREPWAAVTLDDSAGLPFGAYPPLEPLPLPAHFRLDAERNGIRSGELHYIDHPRFGILLMVTPAPEPEAPSETEDALPSA